MDPSTIMLTFNHAAAIHGHGLPETRLARVAARRAFVEMKQCFMRAAADIPGELGRRLQHQVRQSDEVLELWRLRGLLFDALPQEHPLSEQHRTEMRHHLDSVFPQTGVETDVGLF